MNIFVVLEKDGNKKLVDIAKILSNQAKDCKIILITINSNKYYNPMESVKKITENIKRKPDVILFEASTWGKDIAPRIAVKMQTGLSADCTNLKIDNNTLIASRPVYNGQNIADIKCKTRPYILTVKPELFDNYLTEIDKNIKIEQINLNIERNDNKIKLVKSISEKKKNLTNEKIVIAGGTGMKNKENFRLLEDLAKIIDGAVGTTKYPVDKGWRPKSDLIGLTGKIIHPKLYIACGISGANEHLIGIQNSKTIVAINKNPKANIFKVANYGIVGDLFKIIPELIKQLK